ncbi:hypothetical protein ACR56S_03605 [Staphylococcus hominis]|uniref:hypothetical protein n=1 Tax=Staphylococcus hominis TaxID=1290 RepID=UPI003DA0D508
MIRPDIFEVLENGGIPNEVIPKVMNILKDIPLSAQYSLSIKHSSFHQNYVEIEIPEDTKITILDNDIHLVQIGKYSNEDYFEEQDVYQELYNMERNDNAMKYKENFMH